MLYSEIYQHLKLSFDPYDLSARQICERMRQQLWKLYDDEGASTPAVDMVQGYTSLAQAYYGCMLLPYRMDPGPNRRRNAVQMAQVIVQAYRLLYPRLVGNFGWAENAPPADKYYHAIDWLQDIVGGILDGTHPYAGALPTQADYQKTANSSHPVLKHQQLTHVVLLQMGVVGATLSATFEDPTRAKLNTTAGVTLMVYDLGTNGQEAGLKEAVHAFTMKLDPAQIQVTSEPTTYKSNTNVSALRDSLPKAP